MAPFELRLVIKSLKLVGGIPLCSVILSLALCPVARANSVASCDVVFSGASLAWLGNPEQALSSPLIDASNPEWTFPTLKPNGALQFRLSEKVTSMVQSGVYDLNFIVRLLEEFEDTRTTWGDPLLRPSQEEDFHGSYLEYLSLARDTQNDKMYSISWIFNPERDQMPTIVSLRPTTSAEEIFYFNAQANRLQIEDQTVQLTKKLIHGLANIRIQAFIVVKLGLKHGITSEEIFQGFFKRNATIPIPLISPPERPQDPYYGLNTITSQGRRLRIFFSIQNQEIVVLSAYETGQVQIPRYSRTVRVN